MSCIWDLKESRALWIANGIAEDDISGEVFAIDLHKNVQNYIPIMKSSYHLIVDGMTSFYESRMMDDGCIAKINTELKKYGL